ncbi:MAG: hypothetical protein A4S14_00465 [Proteobacteria bacterium SG_bin9]|nr:MAG: hypothetical protein A4S14_00465 [Proteobacteria bacterium SG_bin9]
MRRLILAAILAGVVSGAQAADLPDIPILRGPVSDGVLSARPVYWQGVYAGGQFSWGAVNTDHTTTNNGLNSTIQADANVPINVTGVASPATPVLGRSSENHSGYGVFLGYNSQWDDVVLGIEGTFVHGKFNSNSSAASFNLRDIGFLARSNFVSSSVFTMENYGTIRARAGYAIGSFLPYAFAGATFGQADFLRTATISAGPAAGGPLLFSITRTANLPNHIVYGYTAGIGLDVMLIGGLFARAEFEHTRITSQLNVSLNTVRGGIGYKF